MYVHNINNKQYVYRIMLSTNCSRVQYLSSGAEQSSDTRDFRLVVPYQSLISLLLDSSL